MKVEITRLPSGLQVVSDRMPELETTSLGVYVGAGSRHEAQEEHGLSHLLEHMAFKGTRRRSARDIAEEIEGAGGELNAATSADHTAYYARVLAEDAELALDILADILTDSRFDEAELAREKNVILQEIGAAEDAPEELVFEHFTAAAYPGQPIGRPILGTPATVSAFSRQSISRYLRHHYAAPATIVSGAGAVEHARLVDAAARLFDGLAPHPAQNAAPARYAGGDSIVKRKLEQTHLVVGFEGVSYSDETSYATQVFTHAVGGGMSSRLFQEIRERRGLAYSIYSFHWSFADTGLFGFYAGAKAEDVPEALRASLDCLASAVDNLDEMELRRAKAQMKVSLLMALESSSSRADQIARQLAIFGRVLGRVEIIDRIEALTLEGVRAAGRRILSARPTVAALGSFKKMMTSADVAAHLNPS